MKNLGYLCHCFNSRGAYLIQYPRLFYLANCLPNMSTDLELWPNTGKCITFVGQSSSKTQLALANESLWMTIYSSTHRRCKHNRQRTWLPQNYSNVRNWGLNLCRWYTCIMLWLLLWLLLTRTLLLVCVTDILFCKFWLNSIFLFTFWDKLDFKDNCIAHPPTP